MVRQTIVRQSFLNVYNSPDHPSNGFGVLIYIVGNLGSAEKFRRIFQVKAETRNSTSSLFDFSVCPHVDLCLCVCLCVQVHMCACVCVSTSSVISQVLSILGFETGSLIGLELTK